jgi:nucleotide-binding universal stress UspA family protein
MVHILVALDESLNAKAAFFTGISLLRQPNDVLYLLTVCSETSTMGFWGSFFWTTPEMIDEAQQKIKQPYIQLLRRYAKLCAERQIKNKVHLLLGLSEHIGEMICRTVEDKNIDFLIMGRRGMSTVKRQAHNVSWRFIELIFYFVRIFTGSNSKYCVEHAPCNLLIVKGEWGPEEVHSEKKEVIEAEEQERRRRIEEELQKNLEIIHFQSELFTKTKLSETSNDVVESTLTPKTTVSVETVKDSNKSK